EGSVDQEASWHWSDGTRTLPDHTAKVLQLHEWFRHYDGTLLCVHGDPDNIDFIIPRGVDNPPMSAGATRWQGDVSSHEGKINWAYAATFTPKYVNWIHRNDTNGRCVQTGQTLTYSVTFAGPGFSVGLSSSYSQDVQDCIYTGGSHHKHWKWG